MLVEMPPSVWRLNAFRNSARTESFNFSVSLVVLVNAMSSLRTGKARTFEYRLAESPSASAAGVENADLLRYVSLVDETLESSNCELLKLELSKSAPETTLGRLMPPFHPPDRGVGAVNGPSGVPT